MEKQKNKIIGKKTRIYERLSAKFICNGWILGLMAKCALFEVSEVWSNKKNHLSPGFSSFGLNVVFQFNLKVFLRASSSCMWFID